MVGMPEENVKEESETAEIFTLRFVYRKRDLNFSDASNIKLYSQNKLSENIQTIP